MNRDPMDSFNKPFQSGDGLCYPIYAKNYYKTQTSPMYGGKKSKTSKKSQKGGNTIGNYSRASTASDYPGEAFLTRPSERNALTGSGVSQPINSLTESFLNSNMGITYATQAGGGRRKNKKGGLNVNSPGAFSGMSGTMEATNNKNSNTLARAEKQKGGRNIAEEEMSSSKSVLSKTETMPGVYAILSGGRYKKYSKKGGNTQNAADMLSTTGMPQIGMPDAKGTLPTESVMSGGRYKK